MSDSDASKLPSRGERIRNWAIQYVGIGWFLSQVLASLSRQFGWSDRVADVAVVVLGVGFVATIVLASVSRRVSHTSILGNPLTVLVVAILLGLGVWQLTGGGRTERTGPMGLLSERVPLLSHRAVVTGQLFVYPFHPWNYAGVSVREGSTVTIVADGQVHLSIESLIRAGQADEVPNYEWIGPGGEVDASGVPLLRRDRGHPGRERCLLAPAFPYGSLLFAIAATERLTPSEARGLEPGREVFLVGERLEMVVPRSGSAFFAVNDIYLDDPECDESFAAAGGDPGAFMSDNLGFFTVQLQAR